MRRVLAVSAVLIAGGALAAFSAYQAYRAPGPLGEARDIVVPHGGLTTVGEALKSSGVIRSRVAFRLAAMATIANGALHAGELHFPADASLEDVLRILRTARPVQHKVTIPEGLGAAQIAEILARQGALLDGVLPVPEEGAVLPQTYEFERGTAEAALLARGAAAMRRVLAEEWAGRAPGLPLRSARDALILASVVEHEAKLAAERPMIARVFLNRLADGMKLQADPTAAYAAGGGLGALGRPLDRDDLADDNAYNTYAVAGLPAGPICSPGVASLHAVLHPATGDALYFVADGTGGHVFAASLEAQSANVARYRRLKAQQQGGPAR